MALDQEFSQLERGKEYFIRPFADGCLHIFYRSLCVFATNNPSEATKIYVALRDGMRLP